MNTLDIYIEVATNYIQLFEYENIDTKKKDLAEVLELQCNFWFNYYKQKQKKIARLIIWDHFFQDFELYYWSFLSLLQTKKSSSNLGENYYELQSRSIILNGFLNTTHILDVEKDIFYNQIIRKEEVIIQARKFLLLERYSNLCQILPLKTK